MEGGRENVMAEVKEMKMEMKWIREDLRAMRSCLEKIVNLTEEGLTGMKEEGRVRGEKGSALYSGGKEERKEESPRKRMVEELRWKEEKRR